MPALPHVSGGAASAAPASLSLPVEPLPLLICLFGDFRVLKAGQEVPLRRGGKMAELLCLLAVSEHHHASRELLLEKLWPGTATEYARQSLNTLVHEARRLLADDPTGQPPVVWERGGYRLNVAAGVSIDTVRFDAFAVRGTNRLRGGDTTGSMQDFREAVALYRGDVCVDGNVRELIERERLRAVYLTLLALLADYHFLVGDYPYALHYAQRLLLHDACREDGHRLVMRCHARLGQRAQAMQQYRVCRDILAQEFDATPEPATEELFNRLRLDPGSV